MSRKKGKTDKTQKSPDKSANEEVKPIEKKAKADEAASEPVNGSETPITNADDQKKNDTDRDAGKKKPKRSESPDAGDQVMEIIDDALDETAEDLGLTDESSVAISNVGVNNILTILFGLAVLAFAVFGVISAIINIKNYSAAKKANLDKIKYFESLILPLCASDAPIFDGASSLNSDVAITAACWDIILSPSSNYTAENGNYTISYLDVDIRINKLFGKGVTYTHTSVGDQEIAFEYDEESGMYTIPAYPRILAYFPTVDSMETVDNGYRLTVSYHSPVTNWITSKSPADKVMIYTVTGSGLAYNVSAIEVGEIINTQEL